MLRLKRRRVGEGRRGVWKKLAILLNNTEFDWIYIHYTMRPNKHENSVTMLKNLSTLPLLAGRQPLHIFILQPSWTEIDKLDRHYEFPCFLGLTVRYVYFFWMDGEEKRGIELICYLRDKRRIIERNES